jgi:hypothetical protein
MPQPPNPPPYDTVPWIDPPYSVNNMLNAGSTSGVVMTINPQTGLLTGTPNTFGQFVIGICVEEYRNGQLISVSRRDYQVNVGDCGNVYSSFFAPEVLCESYTVEFDNQSQNAENYLWYFDYPGNLAATSTEENPVFTYPDTGLYTIMLIAEPGVLCTDTFFSQVHIVLNSLFANFETEQADCADSLSLQVTDSSLDTATTVTAWDWELSYGTTVVTSTEQNPLFVITEQGSATLTLTVTSANGCTKTLTQTIPVNFIEDPILETVTVCHESNGVELNPPTPRPPTPSSSLTAILPAQWRKM